MSGGELPPDYRTALAAAVGAIALLAAGEARARMIASDEVAPLASRIDQHSAVQSASEERLAAELEALRAALVSADRKLDALCRANPRANCPLGHATAEP